MPLAAASSGLQVEYIDGVTGVSGDLPEVLLKRKWSASHFGLRVNLSNSLSLLKAPTPHARYAIYQDRARYGTGLLWAGGRASSTLLQPVWLPFNCPKSRFRVTYLYHTEQIRTTEWATTMPARMVRIR